MIMGELPIDYDAFIRFMIREVKKHGNINGILVEQNSSLIVDKLAKSGAELGYEFEQDKVKMSMKTARSIVTDLFKQQ